MKKHRIIILLVVAFVVIISIVGLTKYKQQVDEKTSYINQEMMNHYLYLYDASNTFNYYLSNNDPQSLMRTIDNLYNTSMSYEKVYDLKNPNIFVKSNVSSTVSELSMQMIVLFGDEGKQDKLDELTQISEFLAKWVEWIEEEQTSVLNDTTVYNYYEPLDFLDAMNKLE
jgi:predicted RND superfamily exporter protein